VESLTVTQMEIDILHRCGVVGYEFKKLKQDFLCRDAGIVELWEVDGSARIVLWDQKALLGEIVPCVFIPYISESSDAMSYFLSYKKTYRFSWRYPVRRFF